MSRKKVYIIIVLLILVSSLVVLKFKIAENKGSDMLIPENTGPISRIVISSLLVQYSNDKPDINKIYTKDFINSIKNNINFYKEKLASFKFVNKNFLNSLREVKENEFTVRVHIDDKRGRYYQVIHIVKQDDVYLVSNIEYDI